MILIKNAFWLIQCYLIIKKESKKKKKKKKKKILGKK